MNILGDVKHQSKQVRMLLLSAGVVIVALLVLVGFMVFHNGHKTQTAKDQAESKSIIESVGKLYILPNETPTVAAIKDKSKLDGQAFFKDAQNGDYVLVYPKAKTAFIYRKSVNKLVNVGPINLGNNATQSTSSGQ